MKYFIRICIISTLIFLLDCNTYENKIDDRIIEPFYLQVKNYNKKQEPVNQFKVTAYDLSIASCGKTRSNKQYGISRGGVSLKGKDWNTAKVVAVDPKVIPLGTKLEVEFIDENYKKYNSTYTAMDTGGGVKGNHLDLFLGDFNTPNEHKSVKQFGVTKANVKIIE